MTNEVVVLYIRLCVLFRRNAWQNRVYLTFKSGCKRVLCFCIVYITVIERVKNFKAKETAGCLFEMVQRQHSSCSKRTLQL